MTTGCPSFNSDSFASLVGISEDRVERAFSRPVSELRRFLNEHSVVRNIQTRRSKWSAPRDSDAFRNFNCEWEHWYTFNHGGRSEAQLNIGMYPDRLRIGIGLEFTEKEFGDPKNVTFAYMGLNQAISANSKKFQAFLEAIDAELELDPGNGGAFTLVAGAEVADLILDPPRPPRWLFFGRMLRPDRDAATLEDGTVLGEEINRVFDLCLPWWEKANLGTRPAKRA